MKDLSRYCGDRCRDFCTRVIDDPGYACDLLMRHYRDEYWPRTRSTRPRPLMRGSINLPKPLTLTEPLTRVVFRRRSIREYVEAEMSLAELATVLFFAAGVTAVDDGWPLRTTPSAGALHSTEVFIYVNRVAGLSSGFYYYDWEGHALAPISLGNYSQTLTDVALGQEHVGDAAVDVILVSDYGREFSKYWKRAYRYILLDAGAVMQNIYLAATAMGIGVCAVGAFYDEELCQLLKIDCRRLIPVLIIALGRPQNL